MKQIDRKTFEKAIKLTCEYDKTGDTDFSDEAFDYFYYLSKKSSTDYFVFAHLADCFEKLGTSDEKTEQVMNLLGFELVEEEQMEEKGYIRLIKDFHVDVSCDGELWTSKEEDAEGFSLQIDIEYRPLSVSFLSVSFSKQKGFEFKDSFCILPDVIKAVNERLEEITGEVE